MKERSLGLIETVGLAAAIEAADAAVKSANVELVGYELTRGDGMTVVKLTGNVGAIKAAVAAGAAAASKVSQVVSTRVIARPAEALESLVVNDDTVGAGDPGTDAPPEPDPSGPSGPSVPGGSSGGSGGPKDPLGPSGSDVASDDTQLPLGDVPSSSSGATSEEEHTGKGRAGRQDADQKADPEKSEEVTAPKSSASSSHQTAAHASGRKSGGSGSGIGRFRRSSRSRSRSSKGEKS